MKLTEAQYKFLHELVRWTGAATSRELGPVIYRSEDAARQSCAEILDNKTVGLDNKSPFAEAMLGYKARALAAESELSTLRARVREVVEPFASTDLLECKDCVDNDGKHYQSQWLADALRAARQLMEEVK